MSATIPVTIVDTPRLLEQAVGYLSSVKEFAWDHETRSVDFVKDPGGALKRLTMRTDLVSTATAEQAHVFPIGLYTLPCLPARQVFEALGPLMHNNKIVHLGWNGCFDMHAMANEGVWVQNVQDIMVIAWLLDENRSASLKERCTDVGMRLTKFPFKEYWTARAMLKGEIPQPKRASKIVSKDTVAALELEYRNYSAEDSIATVRLAELYRKKLAENPSLERLFYGLRNPAIRTLFNMERRGIPVDRAYVKSVADVLKQDIDRLEKAIYKEAKRPFKISSPKELADVLYRQMKLPVWKVTAGGAQSTAVDSLDWLGQQGYSFPRRLVEYRRASKMYGDWMGPEATFQADVYPWGHIHPSFNSCNTATGRLSASDPNMQTMTKSSKGYNLRRSLVPSTPGYILIGGDQSQIELRIMANNSCDPCMMAEYCKDKERAQANLLRLPLVGPDGKSLYPKSDLHQSTADACGCQRDPAKAINFGIIYGIGDERLGLTITKANWDNCLEKGKPWDPTIHVISQEQARDYKTGYYQRYPGVKAYQDAIGELAKQRGYVTTRFGGVRRLPDVYSSDRGLIMHACRQAVNFGIQGHVGELMLHCMNLIERAAPAKNKLLQDAVDCLWDCRYRLFLQVHDEVVGEGPEEYAEQICKALVAIFQCPMDCTKEFPFYGYRVPLIFEAKTAKTYDKLK